MKRCHIVFYIIKHIMAGEAVAFTSSCCSVSVPRLFSFCRKDSVDTKVSRKPTDETKRERLASHQHENARSAVGVILCVMMDFWFILSFFKHISVEFSSTGRRSCCSFTWPQLGLVKNHTQILPFVRKDSSDSKPPPPKKPNSEVKQEKHRCAGVRQ